MEEVLEHNSPLYRRFDLSILLKQMDYYDSSKFYSWFSSDDKIRLYSVFCGGNIIIFKLMRGKQLKKI